MPYSDSCAAHECYAQHRYWVNRILANGRVSRQWHPEFRVTVEITLHKKPTAVLIGSKRLNGSSTGIVVGGGCRLLAQSGLSPLKGVKRKCLGLRFDSDLGMTQMAIMAISGWHGGGTLREKAMERCRPSLT